MWHCTGLSLSKDWQLLEALEVHRSVGKSEMNNSIGEERPVQKHFEHLAEIQGVRIIKNAGIVNCIRDAYNSISLCYVDRSISTRSTVIRRGALLSSNLPRSHLKGGSPVLPLS